MRKISNTISAYLNFDKDVYDAEESLKNTILDKYDTIIFDLDLTIWNTLDPKGNSIGAYQTTPPYTLKDKNTIIDINGNITTLHEGIRDLLEKLDILNKNLGIVSRGEKLVDVNKQISVPFEAQPSTMLLKKFDIYKYFNYLLVYKAFAEKQEYIRPKGKTLFIDDDREWIDKVNQLGNVDVLWRKSFQNWQDLLRKIV